MEDRHNADEMSKEQKKMNTQYFTLTVEGKFK